MYTLQRIILVFVLLHFFAPNDFQVGGALSIASITKTRRTQSMRPIIPRSGNIRNRNTQSGSESSSSSINELQSAGADSQPIASSSSTGKEIDSTSFKEVELQPFVEKTKRTSFINSVNLNEASVSTQSNGNINPARDGVFARVRSAMLRYGSAVAIGSVVGVGGSEVKKKLFPNNNNNMNITQVNNTQEVNNNIKRYQDSVINTTTDSDGISNPII